MEKFHGEVAWENAWEAQSSLLDSTVLVGKIWSPAALSVLVAELLIYVFKRQRCSCDCLPYPMTHGLNRFPRMIKNGLNRALPVVVLELHPKHKVPTPQESNVKALPAGYGM